MNVRPLNDWILVKTEPLKKRSTILELPGEHDKSAVRVGTVLELGPGKPLESGARAPLGVEKGEKIAFLRWHQEHRPGKANMAALADLSEELGADVCLVRVADILFAFDGDVHVDI